ncbi:MAG: hypothetical protein H0X38_06335 [Planctomycetes bacterium]|nr:hypothetical protein [Planctomycetota bacterium]
MSPAICRQLLALATVVLITAGCAGGSRNPAAKALPWPESGSPRILDALAEDLQAFQVAAGHAPRDLVELDQSHLGTGGPYGKFTFAYHPNGLGVLREGWRVLVADDRVRDAGRMWCIISAPVRVTGLPSLRVVLVPLVELREAAAAAGGG